MLQPCSERFALIAFNALSFLMISDRNTNLIGCDPSARFCD